MQTSETQGFLTRLKNKLEQLEWFGCSLELMEYALLALVIFAAWSCLWTEAEMVKSQYLIFAAGSYKSHALPNVECSHVLGAHMSLCVLFQETGETSENVWGPRGLGEK